MAMDSFCCRRRELAWPIGGSAIIDLSPTGAQPMIDEASGVVLVFNGEIYNYRELGAELREAGVRFEGSSDTEVILQRYLARGPAMLEDLNGIFAIALWDPRDRSLLLGPRWRWR